MISNKPFILLVINQVGEGTLKTVSLLILVSVILFPETENTLKLIIEHVFSYTIGKGKLNILI
jgi:hypothetical protein